MAVLSRVRLIRVKLVLVNLNPINDTYICDPSALNFSQFVGLQDSPNLSKIEKVAETCEFDGKEPLFVERTITISNRVLG